ncbi:glycosyltransferase [Myroides marinus]|uniref:glycosyltransferase family 2 protein n=1 Tax=Myroides TaxID=76831 RepID=UPI002575DB15|nr:glycosyltransferase [Myroides marinus]MDM1391278.1 glycosyltransferase [Myroides marinus]MDM1405305.1 glycosyltransferase [Myroides marinus]
MKDKILVSITMLVKNSERHLEQVLHSYAEFAEIIVLDNGSTDNTIVIAERFDNVRVYRSEFIGFGPLKNLAASHARYDWILNMDSDEVMTPELLLRIKQIDYNNKNIIYGMLCLNHYRGRVIKACGWYPNIVKRLYNKTVVSFDQKQVHESLQYKGNDVKEVIFKEHYLHYSFDGADDLIRKLQHYTSLYAEQMRLRKKASVLKGVTHGMFGFFKHYFLKKGIFYGADGFVIASANAMGSYYKYVKLAEANQRLDVSLLITTYNRVDALEAVLVSVLHQKKLPFEVIVADDGSREDTIELVKKYQAIFPVPLKHAWQEDNGFRLSESRNRGLALCEGEYVVMIDGDMVLHPMFISDHIANAKKGYFVQGGRVMFNEKKTKEYLASSCTYKQIKWYQPNIETRFEKRLSACHLPWLNRLIQKSIDYSHKGIRGCNMAFFIEDVKSINGFNNEFVGWGREDSEFVERMFNKGVKRNNIKYSAIAYHLYHKEEQRSSLPENDQLLKDTISKKSSYCENGLNQFLIK